MKDVLRGHRLRPMAEEASKYTSSIKEDEEIKEAIIQINAAHVLAIYKAGWIGREVAKAILKALDEAKTKLVLDYRLEDIHMCLEEFVINLVGQEGGFMSLGRSRNDHVAAALRIKTREEILKIIEEMVDLVDAALSISERGKNKILPGYTHMQPAQPTTLAHWLLSYVDSLIRDIGRFKEAYSRTNLSPLGAAALAGSTAYIDRGYISSLLGFDGIIENTMDAVGSRDFVHDTLYAASSLMVTLSRLSQDLIYFSSLGILKIPDGYVSTSSIMPQKRNAVVAETQRAMTSSTISHLMAVLEVLRSLNSTYNLDFQEITRHLWATIKEVRSTLKVFKGMLSGLKFDEVKARRIVKNGLVTASDLAEYLSIKYNIPFRDSHKIVGMVMRKVEGKQIREGSLASELSKTVKRLTKIKVTPEEFLRVMDPAVALKARRSLGTPNPVEVSKMLRDRKNKILTVEGWVEERWGLLKKSKKVLESEILKVRR